jgi:hypothetical protein
MRNSWPDTFDSFVTAGFLAISIGLPLLGYGLLAIDIRAYLRSLRGALVRVRYHFAGIPQWARLETPACLIALGLRLPCNQEQVRQAYHRMAENLHPDRGGERRRFAQLRRDFEMSLQFLQKQQAVASDEVAEEAP